MYKLLLLIYLAAISNISLSQNISKDTAQATIHYHIGFKYLQNRSKYDSAIFYLEKASAVYLKHNLWDNYLRSQGKIAESTWRGGNFDKAKEICHKIINKANDLPDSYPEELSSIYFNLAVIAHFFDRDTDQAFTHINNSIELLLEIIAEPNTKFGSLFNVLGILFADRDLDKSEKNYLRAIKNFGESHPRVPLTYNNIALAYRNNNNHLKASKFFKIAQDKFKEKNLSYAQTINDLGRSLLELEQFDEAEKWLLEDLELRKKLFGDQHESTSFSLNNLGDLYWRKGEYLAADDYFQRAFKILKDIKGEKNQETINVMEMSGTSKIFLGQYEEALQLINQAYELRKKINGEEHPATMNVLNNLVVVYRFMGEFEKAEAFQKIVLDNTLKNDGEISSKFAAFSDTMGLIYLMWNKTEPAKHYLQKSLSIWEKVQGINHQEYAQTLNNLARLYQKMEKYDSVNIISRQVRDIASKLVGDDYRLMLRFHNPLSYALHSLGEFDEAAEVFKEDNAYYLNFIDRYFQNLSEQQRNKFYKTFKNYLASFRSFSIENSVQDPTILNELFNMQLQTKSILLNTTLGIKRSIISNKDENAITLFNQVTDLKQKLGRYLQLSFEELSTRGINIDSLRKLLDSQERELSALSITYAKRSGKYTWQDIQMKLKKNEAAIEMIRMAVYDFNNQEESDSIIYVALILTSKTKISPQLLVFPNGNEMEKLNVTFYRNTIKFKIQDHQSYNAFWKPFQPILKGINKVYLSSDGIYHQINLATLLNPQKDKYLIDEIHIQQVTNLKEIIDTKERVIYENSAVIIGNPDFSLNSEKINTSEKMGSNQNRVVNQLPGTETEAIMINDILKANDWNIKLWIGKDAKEESVKNLESPRILHIATHGFFDASSRIINYGDNPLFKSGLLLAGANITLSDQQNAGFNALSGKEDGILTAYEAQFLNFDDTELVVLSACETGLGDIQNGEGVYGLQRALKVAGAKAILMSLWKVDDEVTQRLMTSFYEEWISGKSKRNAFIKAQNKIRKEYEHPYYWGAFILIGE